MKRLLPVLAALAAVGLISAACLADPAPEKEPQLTVPVSKVVLFTSGVGYFEHFGTVDGDADVRLRFKTEQINDMLKSLAVMDLDGGTVRRVSYGSKEPLERALKSFGVDISGNPTLADLLRQLRGCEVIVMAPDKVVGKVFNVETRTKVFGQPPAQVVEEIIDLVTAEGIKQLPVSTVQAIRLADEQLDSELNKALTLLVAARDKDRKPVDIHFAGKGQRKVRIG